MTGTIIGMGVILIIMGSMSGMPGTIAGVFVFWVLYFGCMMIKGGSSGNSGYASKNNSHNKDVVILECPICKRTSVFEKDEMKKCKYCSQILD